MPAQCSHNWWRIGGFASLRSIPHQAACMLSGTVTMRNSMRRWSVCRSLSPPPNGMPANSSISQWRGFKPGRDDDGTEFLASDAVVCRDGARSCIQPVGAAVVARLGSRPTRVIEDNRPDILRLRFWHRPDRVAARLDGKSVHHSNVRQLVYRARLSFSPRPHGGPSFRPVSRPDRDAVRVDRTVLGDLPAPRARLSTVLSVAAPLRFRILPGIRSRFL